MKTLKNPKLIGFYLLLMALTAGYAYGYVLPNFGNQSQALAWNQQVEQLNLFQNGLIAWLFIALLDFLVALGICHYFRAYQSNWASISSGLRLIYTFILLFAIWQMAHGQDYLNDNGSALKLQETLDQFQFIWSLGLMLFGLHLISLGRLIAQPNWLKVHLYGAGLAYSFLNAMHYINPDWSYLTSLEAILAIPMALAELIFAFYLIFKAQTLIQSR